MIHPKGSMCMACAKKMQACKYNFNQMPIIEKYKTSDGIMHFVVKCTYFERVNEL